MVAKKDLTSEWILDLGFTFHTYPIKSWFSSSYMELKKEKVLMGNNKVFKVFEIGSIKLRSHDVMERMLTNVRYVLELERNLISLGMPNSIACIIKIENETLKILKGAMIVMKKFRKNGLYALKGETLIETSTVAISTLDLSNRNNINFFKIDLLGLKYQPLGLDVPKPQIPSVENDLKVVGSLVNL